jgi:hypothetical protein
MPQPEQIEIRGLAAVFALQNGAVEQRDMPRHLITTSLFPRPWKLDSLFNPKIW